MMMSKDERRMLNYINDTLSATLRQFVGDMNVPEKRLELIQAVERHVLEGLGDATRRIAIVCDDSNNPPESIKQGWVNVSFFDRVTGKQIMTEEALLLAIGAW